MAPQLALMAASPPPPSPPLQYFPGRSEDGYKVPFTKVVYIEVRGAEVEAAPVHLLRRARSGRGRTPRRWQGPCARGAASRVLAITAL